MERIYKVIIKMKAVCRNQRTNFDFSVMSKQTQLFHVKMHNAR